MPKSTAVLRMASARLAPMTPKELLGKALEGAQELYPFAPDKTLRGWIALISALSSALFYHAQISEGRDLYCEAGEPVVQGGERTKKRIRPRSPEHYAKVGEPFAKLLANKGDRLLIGKMIAKGWIPSLS